jgi:hypothetical protein
MGEGAWEVEIHACAFVKERRKMQAEAEMCRKQTKALAGWLEVQVYAWA